MTLKYCRLAVPWKSFFNTYFTYLNFIYGLIGALFFASFIYLEWLGITNRYLHTLTALVGLYMLLHADRKQLLFFGFFTGVFWFWWIAMSFRYYDLGYLIPLIIFGLGAVYALLLWLLGWVPPLLRVAAFALLSFVPLLGFDWFKPELVLTHSLFGVHKWQFLLLLLALYLGRGKKIFFLLALLALDFGGVKEAQSEKIKLVSTQIPQEQKWQKGQLKRYEKELFTQTDRAIKAGYEAVVFPESFLTTYLNKQPRLLRKLREKSERIAIVTGALYYDKRPKNSTYIFHKGSMQVAHKVVLVPFGEANPLPGFLSEAINALFFDGAEDYSAAEEFTTVTIGEHGYTNAICYEATDRRLYASGARRILAISNNAWFDHSSEPALQKLLLAYYVRLHGVEIYHAINGSQSYILKPLR